MVLHFIQAVLIRLVRSLELYLELSLERMFVFVFEVSLQMLEMLL